MKQPTNAQYKTARLKLALNYAPDIYACKKCGWPVIDGCCCGTCRDSSPYNTIEQDRSEGLLDEEESNVGDLGD